MSERTESAVAGEVKPKRQMYEPCQMCVDGAILDGGGSVHQCCCQSMRVMPVGVSVETLEYLVGLDERRKACGITAAMIRDGRASAFADLLAACEAIELAFDSRPPGGFEGIEKWLDAVRMARLAVAKAKGE